jgi:hypothetical protein
MSTPATTPFARRWRGKMPNCQNCGGHVTDRYVRVFTPEDLDAPRVCPNCPDLTRDGNTVREKKT